ncbi:hypothetical protein P261_00783 [Lachnospiraceae bacterium TWA4]|nr:hypothetical protein P261_00783 [Lachnospiraceae bacterium TWA4]
MNKFLKENGFQLLRDNIYFRIHDVIGFDIVEEQYKGDYWTVNFSSYMYTGEEEEPYCFEKKNLKELKNPIFKEYWWKIDNKEIYLANKTNILDFFSKFSSIDKMKECIQFYMNHDYSDVAYIDELKWLLFLDLVNGANNTVENQLYQIKKCIHEQKDLLFYSDEEIENEKLDLMWRDYKQNEKHYVQNLSQKVENLFKWIKENESFSDIDTNFDDLLDCWKFREEIYI